MSHLGKAWQDSEDTPQGEYHETAKGVTVPRHNGTGGMVGSTDPYPPVLKREFHGETLVDQSEVTGLKNRSNRGVPYVPPIVELTEEELADGMEQDQAPQPEAAAQAAPSGGTASEQAERILGKTVGAQLTPELQASIKEIAGFIKEEKKAKLLKAQQDQKELTRKRIEAAMPQIKFEGAFGSLEAPYAKVVDSDYCVVLVTDKSSQKGLIYEPPINEDQPFHVSGSGIDADVVNVGIKFNWSSEESVLVLIKQRVE